MKKTTILYSLVLFCIVCFAAETLFADVYTVTGEAGEISKNAEPNAKNVSKIQGQAAFGFSNALLHTTPISKTKIVKGYIKPNGFIPKHIGGRVACVYIVSGNGQMGNTDKNGDPLSKINFKAGDLIVFNVPQPTHYWKAGSEGFKFVNFAIKPEVN